MVWILTKQKPWKIGGSGVVNTEKTPMGQEEAQGQKVSLVQQ